jgi:hypothetical protein
VKVNQNFLLPLRGKGACVHAANVRWSHVHPVQGDQCFDSILCSKRDSSVLAVPTPNGCAPRLRQHTTLEGHLGLSMRACSSILRNCTQEGSQVASGMRRRLTIVSCACQPTLVPSTAPAPNPSHVRLPSEIDGATFATARSDGGKGRSEARDASAAAHAHTLVTAQGPGNTRRISPSPCALPPIAPRAETATTAPNNGDADIGDGPTPLTPLLKWGDTTVRRTCSTKHTLAANPVLTCNQPRADLQPAPC